MVSLVYGEMPTSITAIGDVLDNGKSSIWSASHRILDLPLSNTSPIAVMDVGISPYTRLTIVQYVSYCCYERRHLTAY
jgi:uncharacterized protein YceK